MKITNNLGLPKAFVEMAKSDFPNSPKVYRVTSLLKGVRETEKRHTDEIEQDVSDMIWLLLAQYMGYLKAGGRRTRNKRNRVYLSL